jgi:PKHD-type hydroxylase
MHINFTNELTVDNNLANYSPYYLWPKGFDDDEIDSFLSIEEKLTFYDGMIGTSITESVLHKKTRDSRVASIIYGDNSDLYDKILSKVSSINHYRFAFTLTGMECLQYTIYNKKNYYDFHNDIYFYSENNSESNSESNLMRKLSLVICLSKCSEEYEGGEFLIMPHGKDPTSLMLDKGDVLAFPSYVPHKVNPVKKGIRKTIVGWVLGPKFK